jgi:hypothetical protein
MYYFQKWRKSHKNTPNAIAMLSHATPLHATLLVAACKQCCQTERNSAAHSEIQGKEQCSGIFNCR